MLGRSKPKQVSEREAEGEIERVYHEIKQTLRVSGIRSCSEILNQVTRRVASVLDDHRLRRCS
jgi:hypothetical protein